MAGRKWWQEAKAAVTCFSSVHPFLFIQSRTPGHGIVWPNLGWFFPPHSGQSRHSQTDMWFISMVVLNPIRLAYKVNPPRVNLICYAMMLISFVCYDVILGTLSHCGRWVWGYIDPRPFPEVRTPRTMAPACTSGAALHCGCGLR